MKNRVYLVLILAGIFVLQSSNTRAEGISVDAGLTPAQDRIIIRMQYRNVLSKMGDNQMIMHMMPIVIAYGVTPDITLMMRNGYMAVGKNETMMIMADRWMDPFFMGKVKLLRKNTRNYSFGIAGFAGSTFPIWKSSMSKTYSPKIGVNASYRPTFWSFDFNSAYEWVNYNTELKESESGEVQLNMAISRNFVLRKLNNLVISPVQELSFVRSNPQMGESVSFGFISPGFQLVSPHFKFETLYQIPVNSSKSTGMKNGARLITGVRLLF
ncbi:hypothetical protein ACUNWD_09205 [Sunxiuqinia sp. A32]|uniref:hypothetical protein n=1 Tax=Sunxiuqinia sp. A32 TaxID=3461496 RepID=UPI004045D14A